MEKFGIIGDPVKGSRSPAIFKAGYDGKYDYDLIEGSDFEKSCNRFLSEYKAVNVTAPFKENAFRKVLFIKDYIRTNDPAARTARNAFTLLNHFNTVFLGSIPSPKYPILNILRE